MADILAGGRIVAELLKPTGQNVLDRPRCQDSGSPKHIKRLSAHLRISSDRHQFRRNVRKNTEPAVLTVMSDDGRQAISNNTDGDLLAENGGWIEN